MAALVRTTAVVFLCAAPTLGFLACGSRTALPFDEEATPVADARPDIHRDGFVPDDASDEEIVGIDVGPKRDVNRDDCPDADATLIYLVTEDNQLLSFFPPSATFKTIGTLACPVSSPAVSPFSMAVDRRGVASVLFNDGHIFRVSTATGACSPTTYVPDQLGVEVFGMGYATNTLGLDEKLYIAADTQGGTLGGLGTIDTTTYKLSRVASFIPELPRAELTGTGDGRLFAFYAETTDSDTFIGEIDTSNAHVIAQDPLSGVSLGRGFAFAFWGGDFYTFTGIGSAAAVNRYRPSDKTTTSVTNYPHVIVGAGVSTCAPQ